jgi:error-prone DNA polymerase
VGTSYAELHCHSNFSFLDGASHPEALAERAGALGYTACALTDHHGLYGIVRFCQAAERLGVRPLIGAEITLEDGHHLVLLVRRATGYANLCRLLSVAQMSSRKGMARVTYAELAARAGGLVALSGCPQGEVPSLLLQGEPQAARAAAARYAEWFGHDNFYLEMQHHHLPLHESLCAELHRLGRALKIPCVSTNNVHYATPGDRPLQDVLTCIRHHTPLDAAGHLLYPNAERYLRSPRAMARRFARYPEAVENTRAIAARCRFTLTQLPTSLPDFPVPGGIGAQAYLRRLTYAGARLRYGTPGPAERAQIEHELRIIARLKLAGYFLIVWDLARFCREQGILCQGRGSAANSVVCYSLGVTAVDPVKLKLLFERFISEERRDPPDIDIDIANNRREEVIQYVYRKYGREHAAMVCEVITYRGRSAVREVGKALGFAPHQIDRLAKQMGPYSAGAELAERVREVGLDTRSRRVRLWIKLGRQILGFPRHLGIHVGGMVITARPLAELVPIENATMPGRSVIQWDKDDAQDAGLIKIDLLGLGMLSLMDEALKLVHRHRGVQIDYARLSYDDARVYDLLCRADTVGVFQVESRAQMNTLPRVKPRCFYDLVVEVALIRPGPIQGGMVHPYLRRRDGTEPVTYPHPALAPILKRTLGVPLFQEQGMRVAVTAAGFTPSQADELRRAMGHKRSKQKMEALSVALIDGMITNGISRKAAFAIFDQLSAFADFGFAESHAASFALLVYVSAYLKVYYPQEFYCALLNSQPMGFYSPASVVYEAKRRGIRILPVDLRQSLWGCTVEGDAVRLGFRYIKKLGPQAQEQLEQALAEGPFESVTDFALRTHLNREALERVAMAGTFRSLGLTRRQALWQVLAVTNRQTDELPLRREDRGQERIPPLLAADALLADFKTMNLSPGHHPMRLFRSRLKRQGVLSAAELTDVSDKAHVRVAGIVVIRQRPGTAKGFLFLTLEDETGFINVVVKPRYVEHFRREVTFASTLLVEGCVEKEKGVINVIGERFLPLHSERGNLTLKSRDFR